MITKFKIRVRIKIKIIMKDKMIVKMSSKNRKKLTKALVRNRLIITSFRKWLLKNGWTRIRCKMLELQI